jgi:ABC-type branched-subunit amino acid transport system ATPase component/branched-subunit amino acid ABC-type transport system permease component
MIVFLAASNPLLSLGAAGLGTGAVYAAVAVGLVLTYRGSGVINFSQALMGLWGAYVYLNLTSTGTLTLPLVGIPANIDFGGPMSAIVALPLALLDTILVAAAVYFLVFRPLRNRPILGRIVASVGVLLTLQSLVVIRFGSTILPPPTVFPAGFVNLGPLSIQQERLWLAGEAIVVAVIVAVLLKRTRVGTAVRAASESEAVLSYAGWSPIRIGLVTWIGGALCTAAVAIPAASITGLDPNNYPLLIVDALACALVGRLSSVGLACASGLMLGMFQSELVFLGTKSWYPTWAVTGFGDALPFAIIAIYLVVRGTHLPTRGTTVITQHLAPFIRRPVNVPITVGATAVGVAGVLLTHGTVRFGVITSLVWGIACLSLVVVTGMLGQISFAQIAIAGIAGFTLSSLNSTIVGALIAIVVATGAGVVLGFPALRVRGTQLAVITLAAAYAVQQFVFGNPSFNGPLGNNVTGPKFGTFDLSVRSGTDIATVQYGILALIVFASCAIGVQLLANHRLGRQFLAVRTNESAAASIGIDVARVKLIGFAIGSGLAAIAGVLIAYSQSQVDASTYGVFAGISLLLITYIGGITRVSGAVVAGILVAGGVTYTVLNNLIDLGNYYALLTGVGVIAAVIMNPQGAAGSLPPFGQYLSNRLRMMRPRQSGEMTPASARTLDPSIQAKSMPLSISNLSVTYGGVIAVSGVDLSIEPGTVVGLIGPNGSGKSSLVDAVTGFTRCEGDVQLNGESLAKRGAHRRSRLGVGRTWQSVDLFPDLSVRENLLAATDCIPRKNLSQRKRKQNAHDLVARALSLLDIENLGLRTTKELTVGQQKLVSVARCLAGDPSVVLLDEPAAGLSSAESLELGARIRTIAQSGPGVLLIDHDVPLVMNACDFIYVLELGRVIASGTPAEVRANSRVQEAYLGATSDPAVDAAPPSEALS